MNLEATLLRWLERAETRAWKSSAATPGALPSVKRCILIVLRGLLTDRIFERAGYMTYLSLLYMVPLVALMLAVSESLGWGKAALEFVAQRLAVTAPELTEKLSEVINQLDFVALGLVASIAVFIAGFIALLKFEGIVDDIWVARARRPLWRTLSLYPLFILAAPTVAAFVLAIATAAKSQADTLMVVLPQATPFGEMLYNRLYQLSFFVRMAPLLLIFGMLALLFVLVPSGRVRAESALIGAIVATVAWQVAQSFYLNFQFTTTTFRAVWGILAQVPLLLLWMYAVWLITLLGVELSFAWQHRHTYLPKCPIDHLAPAAQERAVIEVARVLVEVKKSGPHGLTSGEISNRLRIPWSLVRGHLATLMSLGAVRAVRFRAQHTYSASDGLGRWTVGDLLARWRENGEDLPEAGRHQGAWPVEATLTETLKKP